MMPDHSITPDPVPRFRKLGNLLLIGSAGRNLGKTLLACNLISRFKAKYLIIGLKVTTIREQKGTCPRGGAGCGVCTALTGNFEISREIQTDLTKDTSRLLASGAQAVYWLKVRHTHLREGWEAVLGQIPQNSMIVCESNSLRTIVEPGLFLLITGKEQKQFKNSAAQVKALADRILIFDGNQLHFQPDQVIIVNNTWKLMEAMHA